jgi:tripartite-type tricarboxylate transporter receptor subunit TctC
VALSGLLIATQALADEWPARPIEDSVWASAGGGTDTTNRILTKAMEPFLGGRIHVVNRTGGGGGVAMNHVWSQPRDGYSWLGASEAMQNITVMGFHPTQTKDWRWYIVGGSPGSIAVRGDSPYKTLDDLIAAAQENPGKVKIGHCPIGCVWHLKAIALSNAASVKTNYVPYEGSAPAMVAALTGEIDAVVSSISEQAEYIKAGKLRPLGMIEMAPYSFPGVGEIEAAGVKYPDVQKIPARQWLGIAIPNDVPADVVSKIDNAFERAMQSDAVKELAKERHMELSGAYGEASQKILRGMESAVSWNLWELGVAKHSPEKFGIPKP